MSDNTQITPGAGEIIRDIDRGGAKTQVVQIDYGGQAGELLAVGDPTLGLPVNIKGFPAGAVLVNNPTAANLKVDPSGVTSPISDAGGSLTVDAPAGTPVAVRLSTGSAFIDTVPVSGNVTAAQGAPAGAGNRWLVQLHDGTTGAAVDSGTGGLKVAIVSGGGGGTSLADKAAFTEGTSLVTPMGGELIASPSAPSDGHVAALRITAARGLHANLRDNAGVELGTAGNPLRVDPVNTTAQTVKLKDDAGTAYGPANPLYVVRGGRARTRVTKSLALIASQTAAVIWTPTSSKTFYLEKIILALSVGGALTLFDNTNAAANIVSDGTMPIGYFVVTFDEPWPSSAVNNILKYTSGTGLTGVGTFHGFEV